MASVNFPSEFLLLPLNEMKKIKEKEYPCLDIKKIMKERRKEKSKHYSKKRRNKLVTNLKSYSKENKELEKENKELEKENKELEEMLYQYRLEISFTDLYY